MVAGSTEGGGGGGGVGGGCLGLAGLGSGFGVGLGSGAGGGGGAGAVATVVVIGAVGVCCGKPCATACEVASPSRQSPARTSVVNPTFASATGRRRLRVSSFSRSRVQGP